MPMLQEAIKLTFIRKGTFEGLDNPKKALKHCASIRNINLDTFLEMRTLMIKMISNDFRTKAEKRFDEALEECGMSDYLETLEASL